MPLDETALQRLTRVEERQAAQVEAIAALRDAAEARAIRQEEHAAEFKAELKKLTDAAQLQTGFLNGFKFAVVCVWLVTGGVIVTAFQHFLSGGLPR